MAKNKEATDNNILSIVATIDMPDDLRNYITREMNIASYKEMTYRLLQYIHECQQGGHSDG